MFQSTASESHITDQMEEEEEEQEEEEDRGSGRDGCNRDEGWALWIAVQGFGRLSQCNASSPVWHIWHRVGMMRTEVAEPHPEYVVPLGVSILLCQVHLVSQHLARFQPFLQGSLLKIDELLVCLRLELLDVMLLPLLDLLGDFSVHRRRHPLRLKALEVKSELTNKRHLTEDTSTHPKELTLRLGYEHTHCSITCHSKFSTDTDSKDENIRKHLPVLSSSKTCDHYFCHGCILRRQAAIAEENNGRVPKWIPCMICRTKTAFCPSEPKYHRLLIDILKQAKWVDAPKVKEESNE